jgi:hypothetical protein
MLPEHLNKVPRFHVAVSMEGLPPTLYARLFLPIRKVLFRWKSISPQVYHLHLFSEFLCG